MVFTGRRDDVPAVTAALDVAVLPSYREAQGLTILEAMALSRPVVASDVGGIPEMVEDGVTGLLVRFCIELMVEAVESIYDEGARTVRPSEVAVAG